MTQKLTDATGDEPPSAPDAPAPPSWDEYSADVMSKWRELLAEPDLQEPPVRDFLAEHPALVPGARGFEGGHHGAIHSALFVEARLPGIRCPVPDFLWIVRDTEAVRPVLIEIEAPKKRWFKKNGLQTDELSQALRQLSEWREWFSSQANVLQFRELYDLNGSFFGHRPLRPTYCLVDGRAGEFDGNRDALMTRSGARPANTAWMTFDSLRPDTYARDVVSVKVRVDGTWEAVHAAPTLRVGHENAEDLAKLTGLDKCLESNAHMTVARRDFLRERVPMWIEWANSKSNGSYRPRAE